MNLKCAGCSKAHADVRLLVALSDKLHICNECIEIAVEICADTAYGGDGFVKIAAAELEDLRKQAHQAAMARIWIDGVRQAVAHADAEIAGVHQAPVATSLTDTAITAATFDNNCGSGGGEFPDVAFRRGARWAEKTLAAT